MNWRISSCIMPASSPQISLCLLSEHAGVTHVVTIQSLPKCLPTHHPLLKLPPFCHPLKSTVSASSSVSLIFTFACFHSCTWARVPYRAQPPFPPLSRLRCSRRAATWQTDSDPRACHIRAVHKLSTSLQSE